MHLLSSDSLSRGTDTEQTDEKPGRDLDPCMIQMDTLPFVRARERLYWGIFGQTDAVYL